MNAHPSPPSPFPQELWGEQWQFAALKAVDLEDLLLERPIPLLSAPVSRRPSTLALPPQVLIPGVIVYAGRRSLKLAQWLQAQHPLQLNFMDKELGGLLLNTATEQRWILVTFNDPEVLNAARIFEQRKADTQTLHFLLVQPDDSGVTFTGLWLLGHRAPTISTAP
jgi:hypothetical protein